MRPEEIRWVRGGTGTVERARDATRAFLTAVAPDGSPRTADVLLVVSELVTNAIRHAGGVVGFDLRADGGAVVVVVEDASASSPRVLGGSVAEPGGFGWPIVQRLAREVAVETRPGGGKAVRAVIAYP